MCNMGKKFLLGLVVVAIFVGGSYALARAQALTNLTCPVMPGERTKEKFFVDYQGKRIYLCCRNCVIAFKKRPEKYLKNLKEE